MSLLLTSMRGQTTREGYARLWAGLCNFHWQLGKPADRSIGAFFGLDLWLCQLNSGVVWFGAIIHRSDAPLACWVSDESSTIALSSG